MEEKYLLVKEKLEKYNQEQLLAGYENLNKEDKNKFLDEILQLNFEQIQNLFNKALKKDNKIEAQISPIPYIEKERLSKEEKEKYEKIGQDIIKSGEYAVVTMAGGQRNKTWTQWAKRNIRFRIRIT